jgi:subtilase family serine protease
VVRVDSAAYGPYAWQGRADAAKAFYASHQDAYDFLILFPAFPLDLTQQSPGEVLGKYWQVRNDVSGIGLGPTDVGAAFGSRTRLKGVIDIHSLVPGVQNGDFDTSLATVAHEVAHQWVTHVAFRDPRNGQRSTALLGLDGTHWSYFLDSDASVMYGSDWRDTGGGSFVADSSRKRYSPLDLYLMGFLSDAEVPPFSLLMPAPGSAGIAEALPPPDGTSIAATALQLGIADIVAAEGARVPNAGSSQSTFRAAFAIVAPPGVDPSPEQLAFVDAVRREWANRFFFMTRGRGLMETELVEVPPGPVASTPSITAGVNFLVAAQQADGRWADHPGLEIRDTQVAIEGLAGFPTDAGAYAATARAAAFLAAYHGQDADRCARTWIAIVAAGSAGQVPATSCFDRGWLNADGGVGLLSGYRSTIIDTALAGFAMQAAGGDPDVLAGIVDHLVSQQNGDGGWSYLPGGPSQIGPTAWIVRLLARAFRSSSVMYSAGAGMVFLTARHQPDGGYGDVVSEPGLTAEAALALGAWGVLTPDESASAAQYLLSIQRSDGSWEGSVNETALAIRALREVLSPNLAVGTVTLAAATASDGEVVLSRAQVQNAGTLSVANATVQAFDSLGRSFGPAVPVPELSPGQRVTLVLPLDTTGHVGSTELFVVVDPSGVIDESTEADNRVALPFTISTPPEQPDLVAVPGSLAPTPSTVTALPAPLTLTASVGNVGVVAASGVAVEARVRGIPAGSVRVDLPARSRVAVSIPVTVGVGAGDVPIEVVVDPAGEQADARRDNNSVAIVVPTVPGIDLRVSALVVAPAEVDQGSELHVSYVLANAGTVDGQVGVEIRMTDDAGRVVGVLLDPALVVPAGAALPRSASLRAVDSGAMTVTVDARHAADLQPADNAASAHAMVRPSFQPNLVLRPVDLVASPDPALEAKPVVVSAEVRNVGGGAAGPFSVDFWLGDPGSGRHLGRQSTAGLAGGTSWTATLSMPVDAPSDLTVAAVVDPDAAVAELDESDNTAVLAIPVRSLPDVMLGTGALVMSSAFPRLGQAVEVAVTIANAGGQASAATEVELRYAPGDGPEVSLTAKPLAAIDAGGSASVSFNWTASPPGAGRLVAIVNGARTAVESSYDNGRSERSVLVQDGAVAVTNPYFSPNGNGVKDETELFWRGDGTAEVAVDVVSAKGGAPVRRLHGTGGSIVWDGRDDAGRVVRDGRYVLTPMLQGGSGGVVLGSASTVVDTNRSPLHEAPRSMIDTEDAGAFVDGYTDATVLPDDSGIVLWGCGPARPDGSSQCGLHLQRFDGTPPVYLNANARRFAVAPDGSSVAYVVDDCSDATPRAPGCVSLHVVSLPGGEDRRIWEDSTYPGWVDGYYAPVFSPDGRRVAFILGGNLQSRTITIESVGIDGTGHRVIADGYDYDTLGQPWWFSPREVAYSPDGEWVSLVDVDYNLAMSRDGAPEHVLLFQPTPQHDPFNTEPDGSARHLWMPGGREIAFVVQEGIVAVDVATHAVRTLVEPMDFDTIDPMLIRDGKLGMDPWGEALAFPAGPAGEERWNATGRHRILVSAPPGAAPVTFWESPVPQSEIEAFGWSSSGALMHVMQYGPVGVGWGYRHFVIRSLANLATRLAVVRTPGARYVTFRGTAADVNFDRYDIHTRLLEDGEMSRTAVTSSASVTNAELGVWAPPAPGVYEATLTAYDKAGNARERRVRFTWGDVAPVANLRRHPEFISPNGDGVQDEAVVSFSVIAPVTVAMTVTDDAGNAVRTLQRTYVDPQDSSISWDGADDLGVLAPDGVYWLVVAGARFRVVIDTKRPVVEFALLDDLRPQGRFDFSPAEKSGRADDSPCVRLNPDDKVEYNMPQVLANASWQVTDENLVNWRLESVSAGRSEPFLADSSQSLTHVQLAPTEVFGRAMRITARDKAGNVSYSQEESYREALFLLGYGLERQINFCVPRRGLLYVGYPNTYAVYPTPFADIARFLDPRPVPLYLPPGERALLVFSHTLREPIASLAVAYRPDPDHPFTYDYSVENFKNVGVLWDLRGEQRDMQFFIEATDVSGNVFTSELATLPMEKALPGSVCLDGSRRERLRLDLGVREGHELRHDRGTLEFRPAKPLDEVPIFLTTVGAWWPADRIDQLRDLQWTGPLRLTADISALPSCLYDVRFVGSWDDDVPYEVSRRIDLCGAFVKDASLSGTSAFVAIGETYRTAVSRVTAYLPDPVHEGAFVLARDIGPFDGMSPAVVLDVAGQPMCNAVRVKLVSHLADGTTIDESAHAAFKQCEDAVPLEIPCTRVSVGRWVRHDGDACSGQPSRIEVPISGTSTRLITSLDATLVSFAGIPVAPLVTSGFAPSRNITAIAPIPTEVLAEGSYLVRAEVRDDAGFIGQNASALGDAMVVEHAPPVVSFTSPRSGATVCPERLMAPDGSTTWGVDVRGSAWDAHLEYVSVLVKRPGSGAFAPGARTLLPVPGDVTVWGSLGRIAVDPTLSGDYAIRVTARDVSGNETCGAETVFHVSGGLHLANAAAQPVLFSPDGDGRLDTTVLSFDLDEAADVRLSAPLPDGSRATIAQRSAGAGVSSILWDGSLTGGAALPEGRVPVVLDATGPCGQAARATIDLDVDTRPPAVEVSIPSVGALVSADLLVTGSVRDAHLSGWQVALAAAGTGSFQPIAAGTEVSWGILATIPVQDLAPGDFVVRVQAADLVGHSTVVDVPITVAPGAILDRFAVVPAMVSPNGDGAFDTAAAIVTLKQAATVSLDLLDSAGNVVGMPVSGGALAAGPSTVSLDGALGAVLDDGDYVARITATAGSLTEQARAPLAVDRTRPLVELAAPAAGACVPGPLEVLGGVADAHLKRWSVKLRSAGTSDAILASGVEPVSGALAVLAGVSEGRHDLVVTGEDLVGNSREIAASFVADRTAPVLSMGAPADGAWITGRQGPVDLRIGVADSNLVGWTVALDDGSDPARELVAGSGTGPSAASWDAFAEPDGAVTVVARANDCAGNVATVEVHVVIDSTLPVARLDGPRDTFVGAPLAFTGTADDANIERWTVELAGGPAATAYAFVPVAAGAAPVQSGTLAELLSLPADGVYTVRLTVRDRAGNEATDTASFVVDTTPPRPPVLQAHVRRPNDGVLSWTASQDSDVLGYRVLRAFGSAALGVRTPSLVASLGYDDPALRDGTWRYAVVAVDAAGLESVPSNEVSLVVDATPPLVSIATPRSGALVNGAVDVVGTAYSADDFKEYRVSVGEGETPAAFTVLRRSPAPVRNELLALVDVNALPQGSTQTLRLEGEDLSGNVSEARVTIQIDNQPPAAPVLVSATALVRDVTLTWEPSPEPDLAGYLVYRDGLPLNVPDAALSDPRAYLLPPTLTTFVDEGVPDGTFTYQLQAFDLAASPSPLSNARSVMIDLRAPSARIALPAHLARVIGAFDIIAESDDTDIASLQLEVRSGAGAFQPLGAALPRSPWAGRLDPALLPSPVIELRAVATDLGGQVDPAPSSVFILFDPRLVAPQVSARVDGSDVTLHWTDGNPEGRVAGYRVTADGSSLVPAPARPGGAASASSTGNYAPSYAYDANPYTRWSSAGAAPQWWQLDLTSRKVIERVDVATASYASTFDVAVRVRGSWVPLARGIQAPLNGSTRALPIDPPLEVEALRVEFTSSTSSVDLADVTLTPIPLTTATTIIQAGAYQGTHAYDVTGMSPFGGTAGASASARVYQPSLDPLPAAVPASPITVAGSGAAAGSDMSIFAGMTVVAHATAAADGRFQAPVPLSPGQNTFTAQAVDADGNRSLPSSPVSTILEPPPATTIELSLVGVAGSDVSLEFVPSGDTSVITGFALQRNSGDGFQVAARLGPQARDVIDAGVRNGTHAYRIVAVNALGFEGAASNTVTAQVAVGVPTAPVLAVTAPPVGRTLQLDWTFEGPASATFVERETTPGTFVRIAGRIAGASYLDGDLVNGTEYRYRIVAVDANGNAGPPSNVASGVPLDTAAPMPPRLVEPTVPGAPITVAERAAIVAGVAELGATIELSKNARFAGRTQANFIAVEPSDLAVAFQPTTALDAPPGAGRIAYGFTGTAGDTRVAVEDLVSGHVIEMALPADVSISEGPWLAPGGERVAIVGYGYTGGYHQNVYVGDLTRGSFEFVDLDPTRTASAAAWSHDGARLAYVEGGSSSAIVVGDAAGGGSRVCAGHALEAVRWISPHEVAGVEYGSRVSLVGCDVSADAVRTLVEAEDIRGWIPGSGGVVAAVVRDASWSSWLDLLGADGSLRRIGGASDSVPAFSPDGRRVAWIADTGGLVVADVATAQARLSGYQPDSGVLAWPAVALLLTSSPSGYVTPKRLEVRGRFEVPVVLDPGDNAFAALAFDEGGNRSPQSEPIFVRLDPAQLPDLAVTALVQPGVPVATRAASAIATIRNAGPVTSAPADLEAWIAVPGGTRATPTIRIPALAPGGQTAAALPLDVSGLAGRYVLAVLVDPRDVLADADRTNNRADVPFTVSPDGALALAVSARPPSVPCDGAVTAQVTIANPGVARDVTLRVALADMDGAAAVVMPDRSVALPAAGTFESAVELPVGLTLAGEYHVVATAVESGSVVASGGAPVTIEPERSVTLALSSARATYAADQTVELNALLTNLARNAPLADASIRFEIANASGGLVVAQPARALPVVWVGGELLVGTSVGGGTLASGSYVGRAVVESSGVVLAEATTSFSIAAEPLLAGVVAVAGVGDPPLVKVGASTVATATLRNVGTGTALNVRAHLVTTDAQGVEVGRFTFDVGDLAVSATGVQQLAISTAAFPLGTYALVLVAEYDGRVETLATTRFRIGDARAPELVVLTPIDGSFVRASVTPIVRAADDRSGTSLVRVSVDGGLPAAMALVSGVPLDGTWSRAVPLGTDGPHILVFSAADSEGNDGLLAPVPTNPVLIRVVTDTTPPVVAITGVAEQVCYAAAPVPIVQASDLNLGVVDVRLNGAPFVTATPVSDDGDYTLAAQATDLAGNQAAAAVRFTVDRTAPLIGIAGVADGAFVASDVLFNVSAADSHLTSLAVTLNGVTSSAAGTVTAEGGYALGAHAVDCAGNARDVGAAFTIDKTAPVIAISGVTDATYVRIPVVPVWTATDANLASTSATLNGIPVLSGTEVAIDGNYVFDVVAIDRAGNRAERSIAFVVDLAAPGVTISGFVDGAFVNDSVTPAFTVTDANLDRVDATLDGLPFVTGMIATSEGFHVFTVRAVDRAGNETSRTASFTIDRTPPQIALSGFQEGAVVSGVVTPAYTVNDTNLASVEGLLDGLPFTSGTVVVAEQAHALVVHALDLAGNASAATGHFTIDNTPPRIVIAGVVDGQVSSATPSPTVGFEDANLVTTTVTLDGATFASGSPVSAEGDHVLAAEARDAAGLTASASVRFAVDRTPPTITVSNVAGGGVYASGVAPTVEINDAHLVTSSVTLDGAPFASGTPILEPGSHVLAAAAQDAAGNPAAVQLTFTIEGAVACPAPERLGPRVSVYQDSLVNCFEELLNWGGHDLAHGLIVHSGSASIAYTPSDSTILKLGRTGLRSTYTGLEFWVNGGATGGQTFNVKVVSGRDRIAWDIDIETMLGGPIPPGTWSKATLPFRMPTPADDLMIEFKASGDVQEPVYLDDLVLLAETAGPCAGSMGQPCSDGNVCNGSESCDGTGTCVRGLHVPVDDLNPCTIDTCDPATGVHHVFAEPGFSCFVGGVCGAFGACGGEGTCQPVASLDDVRIYDDAVGVCFDDASVATSYDPYQLSIVHGGAHAIRYEPRAWEPVVFVADDLASSFDAVELWIHGGSAGGQVIQVLVADDVQQLYDSYLTDALGHPIAAGTWERVRIPFVAASTPGWIRLVLQPIEDGGTMYLDDIRFVRSAP